MHSTNNSTQMEADKLPQGWTIATLPELAGEEGVFKDGDWVESKDQDPEGNVRLIQLADIGDGAYLNKSDRYLTKQKSVELNCTYLKPGDLLVSRMADPIARACIFPGDQMTCVTVVDVCIVRPSCADVNTRWLKHAINSPQFRVRAREEASGSTRTRISRSNLAELKIPVPPPAEQDRIADRLDAIQSRTQATEETLDYVPDRIEEYRHSVLNAAFTGRLTADWREESRDVEPAEKLLEQILDERHKQWKTDYQAKYEAKDRDPPSGWKSRYSRPEEPDRDDLFELPETWTWVRLQQLSNVYSGVTKNFSKSGDVVDMPYLRVANVYADELRLDEIKQIKLKRTKKWKYLLEEGDLLVVEGNGSKKHIGRVAEWDGSIEPCVHQNHLIKVRPTRRSVGRYVLNWMLSARGRRFITSEAKTTSGLYTLSLTKVRNIPVPLPPVKEQEEIVRRINQRLDKIDEMAQHVDQAGERLDHLNRSVLAKAFRGELVETEAQRARREDRDYETAGELLNRVKEKTTRDTDTTAPKSDGEKTARVDENGQIEMKVVDDENASL